MNSKKLAYISMLSALAIIFGYVESLFPAVPIPGVKLGISNIVILFTIYRLDKSSAFFIMLVKVLVTSLLFSGLNVFWYSFAGGLLSLLAMSGFRRFFSVIGISITGGICHNIGQLLVASFMMQTSAVFVYLPHLLISGVVVGIVTGNVCNIILKRKMEQ